MIAETEADLAGHGEELGIRVSQPNGTNGRELRIAIIGAGPGGLCMGIRLKGAGFERFDVDREVRILGQGSGLLLDSQRSRSTSGRASGSVAIVMSG